MSVVVLVHGAFHGAWCWYRMIPALEERGHRVVAPDLPGHGRDRTPAREVSLAAYAHRIGSVLDAEPEPVILVGHSMAGATITVAADQRPDRVRTLVYLAALVPRSGQSCADVVANPEDSSPLSSDVRIEPERGEAIFDETALRRTFYEQCREEDVALARLSITPQPLTPIADPVVYSNDRLSVLPKVYIATDRDKVVTPSDQERMRAAMTWESVVHLDTDHSPFFSAVDQLADTLASL